MLKRLVFILANGVSALLLYPLFVMLYVFSWFPWAWQLQFLGGLAWLLPIKRRKVIETNLRLCFPEFDESQIRRTIRQNAKYSLSIVPSMLMTLHPLKRLKKYQYQVTGFEHISNIIAQGQGCLLLCPHSTSVFFAYLLLNQEFDSYGVYRPSYPIMESILCWVRKSMFKPIKNNNTRAMIRALRAKGLLFYACDQRHGGSKKERVVFFGLEENTLVSIHSMLQLGRAKAAYLHVEHTDLGYKVEIQPFDEQFYQLQPVEMAQEYMYRVEQTARSQPSQYYWEHKRFASHVRYD